MPVQKCQRGGKKGHKVGKKGGCIIGPGSKGRAEKQQIKIKIEQKKKGKR